MLLKRALVSNLILRQRGAYFDAIDHILVCCVNELNFHQDWFVVAFSYAASIINVKM